jgi:hypothetical protein
MLRSDLVSQLQQGIEDFLVKTFPSSTPRSNDVCDQCLDDVQFPVLRKDEQNTFYDRNGRIIYTKNRGLTGVGFKTKTWHEVKDMESGTVEQVIEDDTQPGGPVERTIVYEAPIDKCDREGDYVTAWAAFEARGGM